MAEKEKLIWFRAAIFWEERGVGGFRGEQRKLRHAATWSNRYESVFDKVYLSSCWVVEILII